MRPLLTLWSLLVLPNPDTRVDEEGSEGAAATAVIMSRMLFIPRVDLNLTKVSNLGAQTTITVGRTFLLSLVHLPSSMVLFGARVDRPDPVADPQLPTNRQTPPTK